MPILRGLKALVTEAAEGAGRVVTEPVPVTHSVVYTLINICKKDTKHRLTDTGQGWETQVLPCTPQLVGDDHGHTE